MYSVSRNGTEYSVCMEDIESEREAVRYSGKKKTRSITRTQTSFLIYCPNLGQPIQIWRVPRDSGCVLILLLDRHFHHDWRPRFARCSQEVTQLCSRDEGSEGTGCIWKRPADCMYYVPPGLSYHFLHISLFSLSTLQAKLCSWYSVSACWNQGAVRALLQDRIIHV